VKLQACPGLASSADREGCGRWDRHARPRLTRAAEQLLTQRRYAEAAARIRDLYAAIDGPANAADAILEVTGRRPGLDR
jgi:UDP:flavonoid glycosyltransferase YjiC (YdhE family)